MVLTPKTIIFHVGQLFLVKNDLSYFSPRAVSDHVCARRLSTNTHQQMMEPYTDYILLFQKNYTLIVIKLKLGHKFESKTKLNILGKVQESDVIIFQTQTIANINKAIIETFTHLNCLTYLTFSNNSATTFLFKQQQKFLARREQK